MLIVIGHETHSMRSIREAEDSGGPPESSIFFSFPPHGEGWFSATCLHQMVLNNMHGNNTFLVFYSLLYTSTQILHLSHEGGGKKKFFFFFFSQKIMILTLM